MGVLIALFFLFQEAVVEDYAFLYPQESMVDLREEHLTESITCISARNWHFYPERYYLSGDFASGHAGPPMLLPSPSADASYGTYRLQLRMQPGHTYALMGRSFQMSMRIYVNGILLDTIGKPGTNKQSTLPGTRLYMVAFTPATEWVEIIFHCATFHVNDGAGRYPFYVGDHGVVLNKLNEIGASAYFQTGHLVAISIIYLGLFLFRMKKRNFLCFSIMCLCVAVRTMMVGDKPLMLLIPNMNWYVAYAMEYLSMVILLIAFLFYIDALFPKKRTFFAFYVVIGLCILYAIFIILSEPILYSSFFPIFNVLWIASVLWGLGWVSIGYLRTRSTTLESWLIVLGLALLAGGALHELIGYIFPALYGSSAMIERAMMMCVYAHLFALILDFMRKDEALVAEQQRSSELQETNSMLDRLGTLKTRLFATLSHEMRTPLAVISSEAQLSHVLVDIGAEKEEIYENLDAIVREASRLSRLVNDVLKLGHLQESRTGLVSLDIVQLLESTVKVYRPLFRSKENDIVFAQPESRALVLGNADMLTQVIINLLDNANKYTEHGLIRVIASHDGKLFTVRVCDNGVGVDPNILPKVFERLEKDIDSQGVGIGLSICRDVIHQHGGEIWALSVQGKGAEFGFSIPVFIPPYTMEDKEDE